MPSVVAALKQGHRQHHSVTCTHGVSQARGYTPDSLTHGHTHTDPDKQMDTPSHTFSHLKSLAETDTGLHWSTHTHTHARMHARTQQGMKKCSPRDTPRSQERHTHTLRPMRRKHRY